MAHKALLMILDGLGHRRPLDHSRRHLHHAHPDYWQYLLETYPHSELQAFGRERRSARRPDGQLGSRPPQHRRRPHRISGPREDQQGHRDGSILRTTPKSRAPSSYAKNSDKAIHFMGLTSTGGVHSSFEPHLRPLRHSQEIRPRESVCLHCFMDGRDTDPRSGKGFIEQAHRPLRQVAHGAIASIVGRYYAMDRDHRWDRVEGGIRPPRRTRTGKQAADMVAGHAGELRRRTSPTSSSSPSTTPPSTAPSSPTTAVIFFNYRNDRAKELTEVLTQHDMPEEGMTHHPRTAVLLHDSLRLIVQAASTSSSTRKTCRNTLGRISLAANGKTQLHIAETEKYAHVTFFFNGGREARITPARSACSACPRPR